MKFLAVLSLFWIICACAAKDLPNNSSLPQNCPGAYVILPANFIIDIAAGSEVILNTAIQEFAIFCTPEDAQKALKAEDKNLPAGSEWRIYRLDGPFSDLVRQCHNGQFCLDQPARLRDWLGTEQKSSTSI